MYSEQKQVLSKLNILLNPFCKKQKYGRTISDYSSATAVSRSGFPPLQDSEWGWLESTGQRLISLIVKTKRMAFSLANIYFLQKVHIFEKLKIFDIWQFSI